MADDPRAALDQLIAALERHYAAASTRRSELDPAVVEAYDALAAAFERYDEALFTAYDEVTPFVLSDDDDYDDDDLDEDLEDDLDEDLEDDDLDLDSDLDDDVDQDVDQDVDLDIEVDPPGGLARDVDDERDEVRGAGLDLSGVDPAATGPRER
jgi:hypothetical protein